MCQETRTGSCARPRHDLARVCGCQQQVALDLDLLKGGPLRSERVQLGQGDGEDLLVPVALKVAGKVTPVRQEHLEGGLRRLAGFAGHGEVLEQGEDGGALLGEQVGERQHKTLQEAGVSTQLLPQKGSRHT